MAANPDPYRTLGLAPGASIEEIRRAYRRLAKANHPDSAGEAALPRFLAIHAAYESLVEAKLSRLPGARPGATPRSAPHEPWRADPDRARATRDASGRRGARPGRRPAGEPPPGTTDGPTAAPGSKGSSTRADGRGTGRSRKRPSNKATLGSTSYDAAEDEPFEPEWSGGTWYGASSGTYWTINPKEYADPRKHGPEYQRRARAAAGEAGELDEPDLAAGGEPVASDAPPDASFAADSGAAAADAPAAPADPVAEAPLEPLIPGLRGGFAGRVGLALVGWPAIGFAISTIGGEVTGCGRFAAGCVELFGIGTWLAQLIVITVLLAWPGLAFVSAVGTLAALAASVPTAVALSATGGSREPAASGAILAGVLAIAYLAGASFAVVRRARFRRVP